MILRNREMRKHSQAQKQHSGKSTQRCSSQIKHYLEHDQVSSNSHVSTCCSNCNSTSESPQKSYRNLDENDSIPKLEDPLGYLKYTDFSTFLPLNVCGMKIIRPTWDQFSAIPNPYSGWKAHCFWNVGYTFDINMKKMKKSNNIRYRLTINVWCLLSNRSWVKYKWERLLEHETGHYLLGCLCALEFKNRADKFKYTKNYRMECTKIFQETFQEYLLLERRYDEETSHSQDVVKQKEWNLFIKQELLKYS